MIFKNFTQGGQTTMHNVRMFRQIVKTIFTLGILSGLGTYTYKCYKDINARPHCLYDVYSYYVADCLLAINSDSTQTWQPNSKYKPIVVRNIDIYRNRGIQYSVRYLYWLLEKNVWPSVNVALIVTFFASMLFYLRGRSQKKKKQLSGKKLVKPWKLKWKLKRSFKSSRYKIAGLPLVKDSEYQHILMVGTTGTGKSTCMYELVNQARKYNERALFLDTDGAFVSRYYRPGKDIILNPFDTRTQNWSVFADCFTPMQFDELAACFIPVSSHDPIWGESARIVMSMVARKLQKQNEKSSKQLLYKLTALPIHELEELLKFTPARAIISVDGEKTSSSVRFTAASALAPLGYLEETENPFSIRNWIANGEGDLFLATTPGNRNSMESLLTAWFAIAAKSLLDLPETKKTWFFLDELAAIKELKSIERLITEGRKYGACVVASMQDLSQLDTMYRHSQAKTLRANYNTKIFFRIGDEDSAKIASNLLGSQETFEMQENLSIGAHEMRDGIAFNPHIKTRNVVSSTDVGSLDDLEAFVSLRGNLPITKIKFAPGNMAPMQPKYIEKTMNYDPDVFLAQVAKTEADEQEINEKQKRKNKKHDKELNSLPQKIKESNALPLNSKKRKVSWESSLAREKN